MLDDKVILLTGGTGSFGQKFTEIVLNEYKPKALRIFSRGEFLQSEMQKKFNDDRLRFFIGDVRDSQRLSRAMTHVDIVVHAAALKQVPACEFNPIEAVRTNIEGAINVVNAAIDNWVKKVIVLSSDKAVQPVNLYGATKMVGERLFTQANVYAGQHGTRFSCVRYGNVIGSRGSVIPLFQEQAKQGLVTITDERMTRFWLTLEQAVRFVISSLGRMQGGEIFVPKIPSKRIRDLAEEIAPGIPRKITGIRPGEKIHETLIGKDEARHTKEFDDYFVIEPEFPYWGGFTPIEGNSLPEDFEYTSLVKSYPDNNENYRQEEAPGYERGWTSGYLAGIATGKRMLDQEWIGDETEDAAYWRGYNAAKKKLWAPFCGGIYGGM